MRRISDAIRKDLKSLEFSQKPRGPFGIGLSMKVKTGPPLPIHHYREKELETTVVCTNCTLRYAVYGAFAFCPDCGQHNSQQILRANLEVVRKMLVLAESHDGDLRVKLIENALEDCVSAFDAFGRGAVPRARGPHIEPSHHEPNAVPKTWFTPERNYKPSASK